MRMRYDVTQFSRWIKHAIYWYKMNKKSSPCDFVDISVTRADFCMKFKKKLLSKKYTTLHRQVLLKYTWESWKSFIEFSPLSTNRDMASREIGVNGRQTAGRHTWKHDGSAAYC